MSTIGADGTHLVLTSLPAAVGVEVGRPGASLEPGGNVHGLV